MEASDWIAIGVGGYAAIIATSVLVWNIISNRAWATVKVWIGNPISKKEANKPPYELIGIKVINRGKQPIIIYDVGFRYSDGKRFRIPYLDPKQPRPMEVQEGNSFDITVPLAKLKEDLTQTASGRTIAFAWVTDATGRQYKGKIPKIVVHELTD